MPDIRTPALSIPITTQQTVRPTGETISRSTWSPQESQSRQDEIEEARRIAFEQHKKHLEDSSSVGQRLINLENLVVKLQNDLTKVYQLLGQGNVNQS
jgi:hypothetical protein